MQDRAGAGKNSVVPPRWTTKLIVQGARLRLRRVYSELLRNPLQRVMLGLDGLWRPEFRLPAEPWSAASEERAGEVVADFPGAFEPERMMVNYGGTGAPPIAVKRQRDPMLRLRRLENVIVLPHHVLLSAETGEVLPQSFGLESIKRSQVLSRLPDGRFRRYTRSMMKKARRADTPVFVADSIFRGYGHSLMEVIPKLAMLDAAPPGVAVATSSMVLSEFYAALGATHERLIAVDGPLFCDVVYAPDPPLDLGGNVHTLARVAFKRLRVLEEASRIDVPAYVYLSRVRARERRLENEAEIEALFRARGFAIIQPETLSFADQVRLMARAKGVAGPGGSAMHNLMFASPETKALFLLSPHWFVAIDQYVAQADGQFGSVFGTAGRHFQGEQRRLRTWTVDPALVDAAISSHFGL